MARPIISDRTRDSVRALLLRTMPDTCVIYRKVAVSDGEGGTTETSIPRDYTDIDPLPCSFRTLTGRELVRAQQVAAEADMSVKLPALTTVENTDHIVITRGEDGAIFDVEVVYTTQKSLEFARKVYVKDLSQ